jgi:hypothetical protein
MSYFQLIPDQLLAPTSRQPLMAWIQSLPIDFHARLRLYFAWLDYNSASYTAEEIASLSDTDGPTEPHHP